MSLKFGHMSNLVLKIFFGSNVVPNVCSLVQICFYYQRGEYMKHAFNVIDVSPTCGIIC